MLLQDVLQHKNKHKIITEIGLILKQCKEQLGGLWGFFGQDLVGLSKLKPCFIARTRLDMFTKLVGNLSIHVSIDFVYLHLVKSLIKNSKKKGFLC